MLTSKQEQIKEEIINTLGVQDTEDFDVKKAIRTRVDYLKSFLKSTDRRSIVLGISGGVDSTSAGSLAQMAINELCEEGYQSKFIAIRLPYRKQKDEDEAQEAIKLINPSEVVNINILNGTDGIFDAVCSGLYSSGMKKEDQVCSNDFAKGNVKARMRMIAQYSIAGMYDGLVLGTDHNSENITGFYTHH